MRIVLSCLPTLGGSAITAVALARALAERGHQVAVVAASPPFACGAASTGQAGTLLRDGVNFHWPACDGHPVLGDSTSWLRVADLVGRVARDMRADVVNPHYLGGLLPACALSVTTLAPGAALVASAHGTDVTDPATGTEELTAALLGITTAAVTAVSPFLAKGLAATFGVPAHDVHVIPNWVDDPPAPRRPRGARGSTAELLLVHASNFRPVKRAIRCADALAAAHGVTSSRLLLVGDGPGRDAVLARATELGVRDRVQTAGIVDPPTAFALLAGADAVLLPSSSEACSGILLQALSAGLPSVAYDVAGNPGVITHQHSGLLVPDEPGAALFAAATARLAGSGQLRRALGAAARADSGRFSRWRTVEGYERVYATAVATRTGRLLRAS